MRLTKIKEVRQVLFGLATLLVVCFHTYDLQFRINILDIIRISGDIGVEIFLFLSGMGLFQSMKNSHSSKNFYKRRFLRITPAIIITAFIKQLIISKASIIQKIINLTILLYLRAGWYFGFIVLLYILFPIIYRCTIKYREKFILFLTVMCVLGCLTLSWININIYRYTCLMSTRIPIFLIGTLFGLYISENLELSKKCVLLDYIILITGYIVVVCFHEFNIYSYLKPIVYYFWSISIILAIANVNIFSLCSYVEKTFEYIGNYSMEIYLVYETIWSISNKYIKHIFGNTWIYFGMVFGVTFLISVILKYLSTKSVAFIEARFCRHRGRLHNKQI